MSGWIDVGDGEFKFNFAPNITGRVFQLPDGGWGGGLIFEASGPEKNPLEAQHAVEALLRQLAGEAEAAIVARRAAQSLTASLASMI